MLHVGHNARAEALRQFEVMGVDLVAITPSGERNPPTILPLETVRALPSQGLDIAQAGPFIATGTMVWAGGATIQANVVAVTDGLYVLAKEAVAQGRRTSELDGFAPFGVLGADLAWDMAAAAKQPVRISTSA